jgi:hypothetical protein
MPWRPEQLQEQHQGQLVPEALVHLLEADNCHLNLNNANYG